MNLREIKEYEKVFREEICFDVLLKRVIYDRYLRDVFSVMNADKYVDFGC